VKLGDLIRLFDAPEYGYGLVLKYDKLNDLFEIHFSGEEGDAVYFCNKHDTNVIILSGTSETL
jgi:hypothetical protein